MTMCEISPPIDSLQTALFDLAPYAEASPARTSVRLTSRAQRSTALEVDYGESTPVSFANFDPNTSSWKTYQHSLDGELTEYSGTWPRSGMMRSGTASQLLPLAPLTLGTESGLLPTPIRANGGRSLAGATWRGRSAYSPAGRKMQVDLRAYLKLAGYKIGARSLTRFSEWMMGFPAGWTDTMLSRTP